MRLHSKLNNKLFILGIILVLGSGIVFSFRLLNNQFSANALSARDFNPGRIIDDSVFYNKDAMTIDQIQTFLNNLLPVCHTWNSQNFVDAGGNLVGAPYVCLNNYHENPDTGETSFEKGGGAFPGGHSAARIIYDAGQKYGINPQVLLVMLKKESLGPITADTWPTKWQYRYSMGYGCPDSGPGYTANCNEKQAGFYKQVNLAAWQFNYYKDNSNSYRYKLGWNDIQYSPDPACGTKRVFIENMATLSLYIYTPYVPNDGALASYPGTSHCGAYGNRNFYMFFREWFGNTDGATFVSLDIPRWMQTKPGAVKRDVITGKPIEDPLNSGRHINFIDKVWINNRWFLRTEWDYSRKNMVGIYLDDLDEIRPETISPVWKTIESPSVKIDPLTGKEFETVNEMTAVKVVDTITVNKNTFYRTEWERDQGRLRTLPESSLSEFTFFELIEPRYMFVEKEISKIDVLTGKEISKIPKSSVLFFNRRITVDGEILVQSDQDNGTNYVVHLSNLTEINNAPISFVSLDIPRWMQTKPGAVKRDVITGKPIEDPLNSGRHINFIDKVWINNRWFLRTEWDYSRKNMVGIYLDDLDEIRPETISPVSLRLVKDTRKINPITGDLYESVLRVNFPIITVIEKITVNGSLYYKTLYESSNNQERYIPAIDFVR